MKFCCCFTLFQHLRCAVLLYSIIICNTDISNWEFLETSCKYLNNAWFISVFKVGLGNSYISRGNMNFIPTAAMLRITAVSLIGALLHSYWDIFAFWINKLWLPRYCPATDCVLFSNQWKFSTLLLYYCCMLKARILFGGTYTLLQRRLWIGCLSLLLPLLPWQMITQLIPKKIG